MSLYPVMLDGRSLRALVVGGGRVAVRKTRGLLDAGASVRLIAPQIDAELAAATDANLSITRRPYAPGDIGDAMLVVAATSSRDANARIGSDAKALGRLVNVADAPDEGNCTSAATHRAGDVVIAVAAGGVPSIAGRIRDSLASRYAAPYADAVAELAALRARLLGLGERDQWARVVEDVIDERFCESVEHGELHARLSPWR